MTNCQRSLARNRDAARMNACARDCSLADASLLRGPHLLACVDMLVPKVSIGIPPRATEPDWVRA
jgi:hypothetical protein